MATLLDIATGDPDFSVLVDTVIFLDATEGTNLVTTLGDATQDLTVFVPTNAAFADLAVGLGFMGDTADADAVAAFLTGNVDSGLLLDIVNYHLVGGTVLSTDLVNGDAVTTVNGATFTPDLPTLVDNEPDLIDPSVVGADNVADNGVAHVIDKVLLPIDLDGNDVPTITGTVAASGPGFDNDNTDFDLLLASVVTAGLDGVLDDPNLDATVFAPTDAAFIGLSQALGFQGTDEEGAFNYLVEALTLLSGIGDPIPLLTDVLTYHVAGESLQASQVLSSTTIDTLQGGTLTVNGASLEDADPDIADPNIIATDIQASNGVIHGIDGVLLPVDVLQSTGANEVDFIIATDDAELFKLRADNDFIDANGGDDTVQAGADHDVVMGGAGDDLILGRKNGDTLMGDNGADTIKGGDGLDFLVGGQGRDELGGGKHADILNGGAGKDMLTGGKKADTFVFETGTGFDTVTDFGKGDDIIDLVAFGFSDISDLTIDVSSDGTHIDLGDGDMVLLQGYDAPLTNAHFDFG